MHEPVFLIRPPKKAASLRRHGGMMWERGTKGAARLCWGEHALVTKLGLPEWHLVLEEYMGYVLLRRQLNNNTGLRAKPGG